VFAKYVLCNEQFVASFTKCVDSTKAAVKAVASVNITNMNMTTTTTTVREEARLAVEAVATMRMGERTHTNVIRQRKIDDECNSNNNEIKRNHKCRIRNFCAESRKVSDEFCDPELKKIISNLFNFYFYFFSQWLIIRQRR
jgi:hypothetical protein